MIDGELDASRAELVERELQARSRLMDAIEKLVRLRRDAQNLRLQLRRHLAGAAAGGMLVAAAAVILIVLIHRHDTAGRRRRRAR